MFHYFINNDNIESDKTNKFVIEFDESDKNHIAAQRLKIGEHISVVDKTNNYFELEILNIENNQYSAKIAQRIDIKQKNYNLTLFQGIAKGDKLDDVVRATTEIGIDEFCPLVTKRSVVKINNNFDKKIDRYKKIARNASMQSGRSTIPTIGKPIQLIDILHDFKKYDLIILFWEKSGISSTIRNIIGKNLNYDKLNSTLNIAIIIGPEGGIDNNEIEIFKNMPNCKIATLGNTILRTETAGIVASALVIYELSEFFQIDKNLI